MQGGCSAEASVVTPAAWNSGNFVPLVHAGPQLTCKTGGETATLWRGHTAFLQHHPGSWEWAGELVYGGAAQEYYRKVIQSIFKDLMERKLLL